MRAQITRTVWFCLTGMMSSEKSSKLSLSFFVPRPVIGSMISAGIISLPHTFAAATAPLAALSAWCIAVAQCWDAKCIYLLRFVMS